MTEKDKDDEADGSLIVVGSDVGLTGDQGGIRTWNLKNE